ncbi:tRNA guanosine(34) transglycosylase Tgt [Neoehrlichia mikurensis]|uniref:Queuine tRNA-ribosyltransferase n=1 Tax=Neoehrlichia mikurensis TaxID=89586 RepID=A0A9Q9F435_9RICK|nr:tRNA guanosine(34) transglycosylase Tgt [Neoehrlichia mikurensis]QXK91822.1 tRNA guanosine(34) transglycosylase Tgt [Neoehrlichia mikurensis]QXK93035.1 tRNA guanosine(34) transglycosylase Tgt [Neoehrlichia mikurensis]QXK93512.1 tRNA guanosine(34) transglycosylase Tgt [Neoehrlichia mikurensis]UTO55533.1 tRNA guanosine(34) transglycosylase Tgt [Neoehrlichia mikurensis]UTO56454.1 tRNA guanosine(34) transglycosylase Tgt [Neoehrlichia mikurensis]
MYKNFSFTISYKLANSRVGIINTPHGQVHTPAFIFCATKAAIKSLDIKTVSECNTQIILSNTYHLMLQPGENTIQKLGGLHKILGWNNPILTDSGGYQIFSLGYGSISDEIKGKRYNKRPKTLLEINETGAIFKSYINGQKYCLTPEKSINIQEKLGADLIVVLDECTPFNIDYEYTKQSMHMSNRWAIRSLEEFKKNYHGTQALYGVIQGGIYQDLRKISCDFINNMSFFGHAIGGSLGACKQQMYDTVSSTIEHLNKNKPIHLLGIGNIDDIFQGVKYGVDTFDCVHPTRIARHGAALVKVKNRYEKTKHKEHINLYNARFQEDTSPIEPDCLCFTCINHSKGYIHHLLKAQELLAYSLITIHNIHFMNNLMQSIRNAIINNTLEQEKNNWVYE